MALRHYLSKNDGSGKIYLEGLEVPNPLPRFNRGAAQGELLTMMPGENAGKAAPGLECSVNYGVVQGRLRIQLPYCSAATYDDLEELHSTGDSVYYSDDDGANVWELDFLPEDAGWNPQPIRGTPDQQLEMNFLELRKV